MISYISLLSPDECTCVTDRVQALRESWTPRHPQFPFFTLGAASYLDAGPRRDDYYRKASTLNPLLEREFGWLYERLLEALGRHLAAKVAFEPRAARPGFHIFLAHDAFRRPLGRVHFDLQFMNLDWPEDEEMDFDRPISFTLAIRLPRSGAGLRTWKIDNEDFSSMELETREKIAEEQAPVYVAYEAGTIACHSGMLLHQIAPAGCGMQPGDMRLTMQGHALAGRDGYRLYW